MINKEKIKNMYPEFWNKGYDKLDELSRIFLDLDYCSYGTCAGCLTREECEIIGLLQDDFSSLKVLIKEKYLYD